MTTPKESFRKSSTPTPVSYTISVVAEATRSDIRFGLIDLPGEPQGFLSFPRPSTGCHHRATSSTAIGFDAEHPDIKSKARRGKGPQCGDVSNGINKRVGLPPTDLLIGNGLRGKGVSAYPVPFVQVGQC
jgi:hypothetical protein